MSFYESIIKHGIYHDFKYSVINMIWTVNIIFRTESDCDNLTAVGRSQKTEFEKLANKASTKHVIIGMLNTSYSKILSSTK